MISQVVVETNFQELIRQQITSVGSDGNSGFGTGSQSVGNGNSSTQKHIFNVVM